MTGLWLSRSGYTVLANHGSAVSKQAPQRSLLPISPFCQNQQNSSHCVFSSVALRIVILLKPYFLKEKESTAAQKVSLKMIYSRE